MGNDDYLDDGYVAALLAQDAKNAGSLYSSSPSKPAHKPKPNTRFLRNIIKDTDSHNAALLAKEAAESRARLKGLVNEGRDIKKESQRRPTAPLDVRKRQLGDIAAILGGRGGSKRKRDTAERDNNEEDRLQRRRINSSGVLQRVSDEKEKPKERRSRDGDDDMSDGSRSSRRQRRHRSSSRERWRHHHEDGHTESKSSNTKDIKPRRGSLEEDTRSDSKDEGRRRKRSREDYPEDDDFERRHRRHRRDRSTTRDYKNRDAMKRRRYRSRSKSRSPHRHRHRDSHRSRSPRRDRSRSPEARRESNRKSRLSPSVEKASSSKHEHRTTQHKEDEEYDSDPLSSIIGPPPPPVPEVRSRGRGAFSHGAGIDTRFSANYDPTADVQLDPDEENDWDQALEALRDRQKWKKQGADRLRAAGFTDEEIHKWEKGGEKTEEDVKWAKRGESREWDRGKIIDDDGVMSIEPAFGRLKDS